MTIDLKHALANFEADVAIVGAGPAGMAALVALAGKGLTVHVIDEQPAAGGQIFRQPPRGFKVPHWQEGPLYDEGRKLLARAQATSGIKWHFNTTALGVFEDVSADGGHLLWLSSPEGLLKLRAKAILMAPGCYDMPVPFPGWTLPGVMAAGGIQAFIKSQQILPGERFLFVGSHPLQLIVADQVLNHGGEVAAVVFAQSRMQFIKNSLRPRLMYHHAEKFRETAKILWRLHKAGVPILFNRTIAAATGEEAVRSAVIRRLDSSGLPQAGGDESFACDRVGVCYGFLPSSELARQAGAEAMWDEASGGGWIIRHDGRMRSTVGGIYVAGEITGVAGADVAAVEGSVAALSILQDMAVETAAELAEPLRALQRELDRLYLFAGYLRDLARPSERLIESLASDDTLLCRCESISLSELNATLQASPHLQSADAVKLACRTGMGLCQGRYCGHSITRRLASARGLDPASVGGFTPRPPVKPVLIRDIIG